DRNSTEKEDELEKAAIRWDQEIYQHVKPPVNKSISKFEREKILVNTYVMPIHDFIEHAEVKPDAKRAVLHNKDGEVAIPLKDLKAG
ncbi:hypothetical protein ACP3W1_25060, partial [Salmonella enterica]|uniref:hypothetical protein n=1 Tax=Salmonella enterica TaxID=28901 RepID=UPI003CED4DF4